MGRGVVSGIQRGLVRRPLVATAGLAPFRAEDRPPVTAGAWRGRPAGPQRRHPRGAGLRGLPGRRDAAAADSRPGPRLGPATPASGRIPRGISHAPAKAGAETDQWHNCMQPGLRPTAPAIAANRTGDKIATFAVPGGRYRRGPGGSAFSRLRNLPTLGKRPVLALGEGSGGMNASCTAFAGCCHVAAADIWPGMRPQVVSRRPRRLGHPRDARTDSPARLALLSGPSQPGHAGPSARLR
jgi:hypothetical protein